MSEHSHTDELFTAFDEFSSVVRLLQKHEYKESLRLFNERFMPLYDALAEKSAIPEVFVTLVTQVHDYFHSAVWRTPSTLLHDAFLDSFCQSTLAYMREEKSDILSDDLADKSFAAKDEHSEVQEDLLVNDVRDVVNLIETNRVTEAKEIFAKKLLPLLIDNTVDRRANFRELAPFLRELDEYLNNESWRKFRKTAREEILDSFYTELLEIARRSETKEKQDPSPDTRSQRTD